MVCSLLLLISEAHPVLYYISEAHPALCVLPESAVCTTLMMLYYVQRVLCVLYYYVLNKSVPVYLTFVNVHTLVHTGTCRRRIAHVHTHMAVQCYILLGTHSSDTCIYKMPFNNNIIITYSSSIDY